MKRGRFVPPIFFALIAAGAALGVLSLGAFLFQQTPAVSTYTPPKDGLASLTANWSTYRNSAYGFEIKYPPDFEVEASPTYKMTGLGICVEARCEKFLAIYEKPLPLADPEYQNYRRIEASGGSSGAFYYSIKTSTDIADRILATFKFIR